MTFVKHKYSAAQIKTLYTNASKDMKRAMKYDEPDVRFHYCYNSLLKLSIVVCASNQIRVLSRAGHHNGTFG
ncbi:MAG: hypothetical protein U9Q85_04115 [Patescibacteria group bacterium]|nr:hypothetical protein [Patescibacteria group bacterium]